MKSLISGACILILSACSNQSGQSDFYRKWLPSTIVPPPVASPAFTALLEENAPAMAVNLPDRKDTSARFLLHLTSDDGVTNWLTGNNLSLSTQNGIIVGTRGFGGDLMSADVSETATLISSRQDGFTTRFQTEFGGDDRPVTRAFKCQVLNKGPWITQTPKGPVDTILMQEDCRGMDTTFRNFFWVTPDGTNLLQSRQWISPSIGYITTLNL